MSKIQITYISSSGNSNVIAINKVQNEIWKQKSQTCKNCYFPYFSKRREHDNRNFMHMELLDMKVYLAFEFSAMKCHILAKTHLCFSYKASV